jgi:hypothetical protein
MVEQLVVALDVIVRGPAGGQRRVEHENGWQYGEVPGRGNRAAAAG